MKIWAWFELAIFLFAIGFGIMTGTPSIFIAGIIGVVAILTDQMETFFPSLFSYYVMQVTTAYIFIYGTLVGLKLFF